MRPLRIMLVDDHALYVNAITDFLEAAGDLIVVGVASDGDEAVEIAGDLHPDVILLDMAMRRVSGLQALPALRRIAPEADIIMVTLYDDKGIRQAALTAGAAGVITKTAVERDLLPAIRQRRKRYPARQKVESAPGAGATFIIDLPRFDLSENSGDVNMTESGSEHGSETILLLEDETSIRTLMVRILQDHGYTVLEAADGVEALERYTGMANRIDLVMADIIMPRMSGPDFVDRFMALHPRCAVLYISGYTDDRLRHLSKCLEHAMILQKPFRLETLLETVKHALHPPRK